MHKFKIVAAANDQFRVQFVYNAEVMVWSENYKSKSSAQNCIDSIKKNAPEAAVVDLTKEETGKGYRFEIDEAKNGETFVRFRAANGEIMVRSETYKSKSSAKNCIESVKKNAPGAGVADETAKA
ncbi:MAG: YegP family protein [Rhizobiaceae bacterium]|nr:YegP family protein [Rhizobiaceae bacterium]